MKLDTVLAPKRTPRMALLPLRDVIFLVLVAFICDTLQMVVHRGVPVVLPGASSVVLSMEDYLAVTVTSDGSLFVAGRPVDLPGLSSSLSERLATGPIERCFVAADRTVPHGQVVAVLDVLRQLGIQEVALETMGEGDP
ncbi:MAG: biopolymer transport protein ExbD [Pseudohongiellaceae bacterium]|jgi:biopolymer transport protein ExbD